MQIYIHRLTIIDTEQMFRLAHHRETKSVENVSQECAIHSWGSKEAENAADEIMRKKNQSSF